MGKQKEVRGSQRQSSSNVRATGDRVVTGDRVKETSSNVSATRPEPRPPSRPERPQRPAPSEPNRPDRTGKETHD